MKTHKKIKFGIIVCLVLGCVFLFGCTDSTPISDTDKTLHIEQTTETEQQISDVSSTDSNIENKQINHNTSDKPIDEVVQEQVKQETVSENEPISENSKDENKQLTCTLSVKCDTILNNIGKLDIGKIDIVPKDGIIFAEKTVVFYEGESVFNVLVREMKKNKIHLEFEDVPIYNSAYIEGIANFYEFDCGELSGWMYKVNDLFPNYGCSNYLIKDGDKIEWVYTCDLGADVGGSYSARNGN